MEGGKGAVEAMGIINKEFWKGKKVFVTGHTGFKGSWLCLWLHSLGAEVYGYALNPPTKPSIYQICNVEQYMTSIIGDIRNYKLLNDSINNVKPDIVIHMAAQPLVRLSYKDPVETYSTNVMGTINLFESIRNSTSVRAVVNVTTDKCYENKEWAWGYRENEPMGGYDPYSNSKACSELITSAYRNSFFSSNQDPVHGVALASARAGNVIGGGDWAQDRLIPDCIRALLVNENIVIRNPNSIRPWQHVLEPLSGYLLLAQKLYESGPEYAQAWNFGPEDNDAKPVEWIVSKLCDAWQNSMGYTIDDNIHPHEAHYLKLDCSKAKADLGWFPRWNLEKAIEKIVEWTVALKAGEDMRLITLNQIKEFESKKVY